MMTRFRTATVALSALCFSAWMSATTPAGTPPQTAPAGSRVPCAVPLAWRIARVDREFGVSVDQVRAAFQEAARLWETAAGTRLFTNDSIDGFPVRLVYDERQESALERARAYAAAGSEVARLDREAAALTARARRQQRAEERQAKLLADLERRVSEHNETVRGWNQLGGAPPNVGSELQAVGAQLRSERAELERGTRELETARAALESDQRDFERRRAEQRERAKSLERSFPTTTSQAGIYREAVHMEDGQMTSVSREIRIYRFLNGSELRAVAAHELGHALGLGHVDAEGAIMRAERDTGSAAGSEVEVRVKPADIRALRAACPDLVSTDR